MQPTKKKNFKELLVAFFQRFRTEDIFWETEKNSNVLVAYGMLSVMMVLGTGILAVFIAELDYDYGKIIWISILIAFFLLPFPIYSICVKGNRRWLKYILLLNSSIALVCINIASPYPYILLLVVPIALSTRYYSVGFTRTTAFVTGLLHAFSIWVSLYFELPVEYDLNYAVMPAGAVFTISDSSVLAEYVSSIGIDRALTLKEMMVFALPSRLLELALITAICVAVARRGRKMVEQQATESAERASIETELSLAAQIQLSALPTTFPAFPDNENVDLYATMTPAREVGGDFYDFFAIDDDHIGIVMADVSGKGIPSAMFMMTGKSQIKDFAQQRFAPSEVFKAVNAQLCANNKAELFITAWLGVLEVSTGKLSYVNAGHCRPLLFRKETREFTPLDEIHGLPLACFEDMNYGQSFVQLSAGDELYLYTDGVSEATSSSGEMYGIERLITYLNTHASEPLQDILHSLRKDVDAFVGAAPQFDDITMLILRLYAGE